MRRACAQPLRRTLPALGLAAHPRLPVAQLATSVRYASDAPGAGDLVVPDATPRDSDDALADHEAADDDGFNVLEATLQETHDCVTALLTHSDRLVHQEYAVSDLDAAKAEEAKMTKELVALLKQPSLVDAMFDNVALIEDVAASTPAHPVPAASPELRKYHLALGRAAGEMFHHAPYELRQIRSDVSPAAVAQATARRDKATLHGLMQLMEPHRGALAAAVEDAAWAAMKHRVPGAASA